MAYYVGQDNDLGQILGEGNARYFYALRRDDDGLLFFAKIDQLVAADTITINNSGLTEND